NSALATARIALESARRTNDQVGEVKAAVLSLGIASAADSAIDSTLNSAVGSAVESAGESASFDIESVHNRLRWLAHRTFYRMERAVACAQLTAKERNGDSSCSSDLPSNYLSETASILQSLNGSLKGVRKEWLVRLAESLNTELNSTHGYSPTGLNSFYHQTI